ncbi:MAG: phosphoserine phosphatase SerB, partial [Alphaproteobacteria bacterium]|nr:phosphoserine phosphatase SerB [Alphaproteobacteria bacterium]
MSRHALVLTGTAISRRDVDLVTAVVATYSASAGAAAPTALDNDHAREWLLDVPADAASRVVARARETLAGSPVDINIVPADARRRKKLLLADMDSTIIEQECIDEIADLAGCGPEVAAITERAMRGELDFEQALRHRVGLLEGLDVAVLERVITERLTIKPGAKQLVATMRANGAYCALVSGGFTFFTGRVSVAVGFDEHRANILEIADGRLTGRPVAPILGADAKLGALEDLRASHGLGEADTLAVGDGANDLRMIRAAGLGVAFHAKPVVAAEAAARIDHGDL